MAAKGIGRLQAAGRYMACSLKHTNPSPFLPMTIEHWAGLPYVVDADINYAKDLLQESPFNRRQLIKIIRYARKNLQDKLLDCTNFINLKAIM